MDKQSATVEHTVFGAIDKDRLEYIANTYNSENVNIKNFSKGKDWRDLLDVQLYHPSSITRHEASFVIGELVSQGTFPVEILFTVVKFDNSIVAKHEAVEAIGRAVTPNSVVNAYRFLRKISGPGYDDGVYHPDVQSTIKESLAKLEKLLTKLSPDEQRFAGYFRG